MSEERRYSDEEVAEILERATTSTGERPAAAGSATGMTLTELKEIGAEVGIDPARIETAAGALVARPAAGSSLTFAGAQRTVLRTVRIHRALDDDEWSRLVAELRETFGAVGEVRVDGNLRSWSNGNLQVHVEPEGTGYRVRMRTLKGDLVPRLMTSGFFLLMATIMLLVTFFGSSPGNEAIVGWIFAAVGLGNLGHTRWMLGRWSRERAGQFEELAQRIPRLMRAGEGEG